MFKKNVNAVTLLLTFLLLSFFLNSQFRVVDTSTGVAREVLLTDHRQVENKLTTQKNEMMKIQQHLDTLGKNVSKSGRVLPLAICPSHNPCPLAFIVLFTGTSLGRPSKNSKRSSRTKS